MAKCKSFSKGLVCFDDGTDQVTLFAHTEYGVDANGDAVVVATRYTDSADVPVDTSAGTVTVGACLVDPPIPADVESKTLCDVQADGSVIKFCRITVTTFDEEGDILSRTAQDYEIDGTTEYVIAGAEEVCNDDCEPAVAQGVLSVWA